MAAHVVVQVALELKAKLTLHTPKRSGLAVDLQVVLQVPPLLKTPGTLRTGKGWRLLAGHHEGPTICQHQRFWWSLAGRDAQWQFRKIERTEEVTDWL